MAEASTVVSWLLVDDDAHGGFFVKGPSFNPLKSFNFAYTAHIVDVSR